MRNDKLNDEKFSTILALFELSHALMSGFLRNFLIFLLFLSKKDSIFAKKCNEIC